MKKLLFIVLATVLALSVGLVGCGGEGEGEGEEPVWNYTIPLDCHLTVPNNLTSVAAKVYLPWITELEALNGTLGGKFDVTVTYGDTPYDSTNGLWALSTGVCDMGQLAGDLFKLGGIGVLPWFFPNITSAAYATHYLFTEGNGTWDKLGELDDVKILVTSPLWGAQWFGHVNATVPSNLTGLKVRAETADSPIVSALGAVAVNIPTSDLANQLLLHTVDGCFFTYSAWNFGIHTAVNFTTELNMFYRSYVLAMNKDVYDAMPAEARAALDTLCTPAKSVALAASHLGSQGFSKGQVAAAHCITFISPAELALWKTATSSVATNWTTYLNGLSSNWGTDLMARAAVLVAESP